MGLESPGVRQKGIKIWRGGSRSPPEQPAPFSITPGRHPPPLRAWGRPWVLEGDARGCFLASPRTLVPFAWPTAAALWDLSSSARPTCCLLRESAIVDKGLE